MPRILLNLTNDSRRRVFTDADEDRLTTLGEVATFNPQTDDPTQFAGLVADANAMLTCWGSRKLTPDDLPADGRDQSPFLVAHAAGSVRGLMPKTVLGRGDVRLSQGAAAMVPAVAQLTVSFLVLALRQGFFRRELLRAGQKADASLSYRDLTGLTIGLVGLSRVAQAVVPLLVPFGCRLVAWDPYWTPERAAAIGVTLSPDLDTLLSSSDAVSLHAPVTPETRGLLDGRRVALLPPGTALVNTARAELVDQEAVFARAIAGDLEYYTDVTTPEPLPVGHAAWNSPHIFITPHIAGPTGQTLRRMATIAIDEIERFLRSEPLQHEVTHDRYDLLA